MTGSAAKRNAARAYFNVDVTEDFIEVDIFVRKYIRSENRQRREITSAQSFNRDFEPAVPYCNDIRYEQTGHKHKPCACTKDVPLHRRVPKHKHTAPTITVVPQQRCILTEEPE